MFFSRVILFLVMFLSVSALGLEIDQKLTLRFLRVSSTQKTVLVNRGIEDGLVQGDHANFFVPEGVVARGVIIKIAPTRSVWSIYRMVNPAYLKAEEVLNLKITEPIKISEDPSRQVWTGNRKVRISNDNPGNIRVAEGASDEFNDEVANSTDPELDELMNEKESLNSYKYEFFGGVNFSNQSVKATPSAAAGGGEISGAQQTMLILLAGEIYYLKPNHWLSNFSVAPFIQLDTQRVFGQRGTQVGNNSTDIGFMINYHPFKAKPWHVGKFIPFFNFTYAIRSASDTFDPGNEVSTTTGGTVGQPESFSGDGSGSMMAFGAGIKTYINSRWGMRALLTFESSSLTFGADANSVTWTRSSSGMRIMTAIGYRF